MPLFQQSVIQKHLESFDKNHIEERWQLFRGIFHSAEKQQNIRNSKEEQYQEGFLRDLFVTVLGYTINPEVNFNLLTEQKNANNSKKADGAIVLQRSDGKSSVVGVIELKGTETTDLNKIEIQAFGYKNNQPGCNYVITSNFEKLRFYIDNTTQQEEFNLFTLTKPQFELLYACLAWESIRKNTPMQILNESVSKENTITKSLYKDYSEFKRALFANLVEMNPQYDKLILFKKTQKLLDRFLFIFFAEDRLLLPTNLIFRINKEWENIVAQRIQVSLYDRYKMYFNDLNIGAKVTLPAFGKKTGEAITAEFEIFAYNGGLFQPDELLDNIQIDDTLLHTYTQKMSHYNFESDVDVNILGHIFENSLNEMDEIKSELEGNILEKTKTRRKKDGVFYTPKYITKYIVDNTVGKLCTEKKEEIKLLDEDYTSDFGLRVGDSRIEKPKAKKKALLDKLTDYRNWLLDLTICDPACGSGAFLNQALEFLIAEHRYVDELQAKLLGDSLILSDIEKSILERNIYGVDLNDESVEIAKLSLWLRTAQKGRKLNSLNNNIKCGNSLIDDPAVAGDKAFSWEKEFPEVFEKGGFDVVIGNPPYGAYLDQISKDYFQNKFKTFQGNFEIYFFFIELIESLLKKEGKLGFITPDTWIKIPQAKKLREHILDNYGINNINIYKQSVFVDASVNAIVFILSNKKFNEECEIIEFDSNLSNSKTISISKWNESDDKQFQVFQNSNDINIIEKIIKDSELADKFLDICQGIVPYSTEHLSKEEVKARIYHSNTKLTDNHGLWIQGKAINRYDINLNNTEFLNYGSWLHRSRKPKYFNDERILVQEITGGNPPRISAVSCNDVLYHDPGIISCLNISDLNTLFLLSLINSRLLSWFNYKTSPKGNRVTFPKVLIGDLRKLPIKNISQTQQELFIKLVKSILDKNKLYQIDRIKFSTYFSSQCHLDKIPSKLEKWYELEFVDFIKELNKAIKVVKGTPLTKKDEFEWMDLFEENKKKALELKAEIDKTDKEIDVMVYELYGLSEEEIRIVEGGN
jgi:type I restriction-modification system DNA methylase subunit